jgi:hydrogenase expression/formation protein HypC
MELVEVGPDGAGVVELAGVRRHVRLDLLPDAAVGESVIVHAGYAIERLDREEASARIALFEALARHYEAELGEPVGLVAPPPGEEGRR